MDVPNNDHIHISGGERSTKLGIKGKAGTNNIIGTVIGFASEQTASHIATGTNRRARQHILVIIAMYTTPTSHKQRIWINRLIHKEQTWVIDQIKMNIAMAEILQPKSN